MSEHDPQSDLASLGEVSLPALRRRLAERLDPLDSAERNKAEQVGSDYDLNPAARPARQPSTAPAAVLAPIVVRPEGLSVILTRRADSLTRHSGQIAFPGGRLDPGETWVEAALREAHEEIGLDPGFVEPIGLSTRYETVSAYQITPVVALLTAGFTLAASPLEVAEIFEVPFQYLMTPSNYRRESIERDRQVRSFYAISWGGYYIWGATAGMLRALSLRLLGQPAEDQKLSCAVSGPG